MLFTFLGGGWYNPYFVDKETDSERSRDLSMTP
jgi:hypothetical protein